MGSPQPSKDTLRIANLLVGASETFRTIETFFLPKICKVANIFVPLHPINYANLKTFAI